MLALAAAAAGCTHATSTEKGGLVTVRADESAVERAYEPRRFALLIGINEVQDDRWRTLRYARKDAADLAEALRDPARGAFTSVTVLDTAQATTRESIVTALKALVAQATRPDDIVLLYVSAHGTLARDERGALKRYLVTSDAKYERVSETALPVEALQAGLGAANSRRRVLVLATCHSGGGKSLLPRDMELELASLKAGGFERPLETASRAAMVLSASDWGETAREDETLQNDVYTHFLVESLAGNGDRNGDGAVTATEAHDYARRRTWAFSQGRQRPSAEILEVGADPIVLSGSILRSGRPELYSYSPRLDGFTLKVDGEERTELPGGAAVPAGRHSVELTKGGAVLLSDQVSMEVGQRIDLDELVSRAEPSRAISLIGGAFTFLDQKSRDQVLGPAPSVGASIRFERVVLNRISIQLDASGFAGAQALKLGGPEAVPFTYTSVMGGAAAMYTWDWRRVSVWVGPRVAALWVQRSFSLEAYKQQQAAFTVTPGAMVGGVVRLTSNWEISVNAQLMLTLLTVDGAMRVMGFTGGWAGVGYRF